MSVLLLSLGGCNRILGLERPLRDKPGAQNTEVPDAAMSIASPDGAAASSAETEATTGGSSPTSASSWTSSASSSGAYSSGSSSSSASSSVGCDESECSADELQCSLGALKTCERDALGCWVWSKMKPCPSGECASETECFEAGTNSDTSSTSDGCETPPCAALGGTCDEDGQCSEGKCNSTATGARVCSVAHCDAVCKSYAPNGRDCTYEEDDARCGEIQCPLDSTCRRYKAATAVEDRCIDGRCGQGEAVCAFVARGEGERCGDELLCDDAGNCNVSLFEQGAACSSSDQCSTGYCVDGVCCESDCDNLCMECRPGTGKCDVMPEDDAECPQIACESDYYCSTSLGNIVTQRCARLGACKTDLDCPFDYEPKGTFCYGSQLCDGKGECATPLVECGVGNCEVSGEYGCCVHTENEALQTPVCAYESDCLGAYGTWHVQCDEHSDCNIDEQLCCGDVTSWGGATVCMPTAECNLRYQGGGPVVTTPELCESPEMGARTCSNGQPCIAVMDTLPGFKFCQLP